MMDTLYLDEAGGESEGFTVVCGWVSTVALWEQFEIDWKLFLASYKVDYFHMKEFAQSKGPFKKWKGKELIRARFMADASQIIMERVRRGVICNVHHTIFDRADKTHQLRKTLASPYAMAGRACVAQIDKRSECKDVEYVFEDGGPDKGGLHAAMNVEFKLPDPIFKPSRDIKDRRGNIRKGVVQLQAADYLAYEMRKHRRDFADRTGRPARQSLRAILDMSEIVKVNFTGTNTQSLCQLEKPIPRRAAQ